MGGNRRLPAGGSKVACFAIALFALCGHSAVAWHAWVGNEALPTRAGTNLESFLELPPLSDGLTNLSLALTSFKKVTEGTKCTHGQTLCSLECATAWGSFLRDMKAVVGDTAPDLKMALRAAFPEGFPEETIVSPVSSAEMDFLRQDVCLEAYQCDRQHCTPGAAFDPVLADATSSSDEVASLQPSDCAHFSVQDGAWHLPFLTWRALHESYIPQSLGHVGGLGLLADQEHSVWACISQPLCNHLQQDDQACFKYSEVRGEFHFWGWNSLLDLAPPLFEVEVSFCDNQRVTVANARTGQPVTIQDATYSVATIPSSPGDAAQILSSGALFTLGRDGCRPMLLKGGQTRQLSVQKPLFYPFSLPFWIPLSPASLPVALYPLMNSVKQSSIGLSLSWCKSPADLDIWVSLPFVTGRPFRSCRTISIEPDANPWRPPIDGVSSEAQCVADGTHVWAEIPTLQDQRQGLYFKGPRHAVSSCAGDAACVAGEVTVEHDEDAGYGPESLQLRGDLPAGRYEVFVHVEGDGETFDPECNHVMVTLYTELAGSIRTFQAGLNTTGRASRAWWHVLNIRVDDASDFGDVCTWVEEVDQTVEGYTATELLANAGVLRSGTIRAERRVFCVVGQEAVEVRYLHFVVRSVTTGEIVPGASYEVRQSGVVRASGFVDALPATGLELLAGDYQVSLVRPGYVSQILCVSVDQTDTRKSLFLSPADDTIRAILRWGGQIPLLHLYVVPVGTVATWERPEDAEPTADVNALYVGKGSPELTSGSARIALGSIPDSMSEEHSASSVNFPASVELTDLPPGQFRVYVSAPPVDQPSPVIPSGGQCSEEISVDVVVEAQVVATVAFTLAPVKWWYVGYFWRYDSDPSSLSWITEARALRGNPLPAPLTLVTLSVRDAVSFTPETSFAALSYEVYRESTTGQAVCSCLNSNRCTCNGEIVTIGSLGPDSRPCNPFGEGALACDDLKWEPEYYNAIFIQPGLYRVVLRMVGYVDRYIPMAVQSTDVTLSTTMVPIVPPDSLRAVLLWGERPDDLDLWVVSASAEDTVYWQRPDLDPTLDDIKLDTDATTGFGPESMLFGPDATDGLYQVVVNVYQQLDGEDCDIVACSFLGGETVEFYDSSGLITSSLMPTVAGPAGSAGSWWLAAKVTVGAEGYVVDNSVVNTQDTDTTCSAVFTPQGGQCEGTYCGCECTSNCGDCPVPAESCPTYYYSYYDFNSR